MTQPCVCTTVRKANRALFRFYEDAMDGTGVTVTQFSILRDLQREGPSPLSRIADRLVMERTSLYRTIRPLEQAGAISITHASNRKIRVAELTASGQILLETVTPAWQQAQTRVVNALGAERWEDLSAALLCVPDLIESVSHE
jgi:DNA-binding MarR family transcriptional regulator